MNATTIQIGDAVAAFRAAILEHGLKPDEILPDGKLRRFDGPDEKRGKRSAWCVLHGDGLPAGSFGYWRTGLSETWCAKSDRAMTAAERQAQRKRIEQAKAEAAAERAKVAEEAAAKCVELWKMAGDIDSGHVYIKRKGIKPCGAKQLGDSLLIPLRDADGELRSLQFIQADGAKRFKTGGTVAGCYAPLGGRPKPGTPVLLCEGWATACSLREATGYSVAAAMNAGNLLAVAQVLRAKMPDVQVIICADDDSRTQGNPGFTKAQEAAEAIGGMLAVPDFGPERPDGATDFNDMAQLLGLGAVQAVIEGELAEATRVLPVWFVPKSSPADLERIQFAADGMATFNPELAARLSRRGVLIAEYSGTGDLRAALDDVRRFMPNANAQVFAAHGLESEISAVAQEAGAFVRLPRARASWADELWADFCAVTGSQTLGRMATQADATDDEKPAGVVARASGNDGAADHPPMLDKDDPMSSARTLIARKYLASGVPTLAHASEQFYEWATSHYDQVEDGTMRSTVWSFLDSANTAKVDKQTGEAGKFKPTRSKVADVLEALKAVTERSGGSGARWLRGGTDLPPRELMPCANGLLHLKTGRLIPPTPDYFCVNASAVAYDANGPEPKEWLAFLDQVLHGDAAAIRELQKIFGYVLTQDYRHQKIFLLIGPSRSGKGTVARILTALLGAGNVATPQLSSLAGPFGLMQFIDKSLAVFGDARTASMDSVARARAVEVLLGISGGDAMSINRKNRDFLNCVLPTRMVILSNEVPNLPDASTALASRFVVIEFKESFLGREDTELGDRLLGELSGILNWAAQGWLELEKDGRFSTPESARQASDQLRAATSPITEFVHECCEIGSEHSVTRDVIHDAYLRWCESEGIKQPRTKGWFVRDLRAAYQSLSVAYQGGDTIFGIGLRTSASVSDMNRARGGWNQRSEYETF